MSELNYLRYVTPFLDVNSTVLDSIGEHFNRSLFLHTIVGMGQLTANLRDDLSVYLLLYCKLQMAKPVNFFS